MPSTSDPTTDPLSSYFLASPARTCALLQLPHFFFCEDLRTPALASLSCEDLRTPSVASLSCEDDLPREILRVRRRLRGTSASGLLFF